MRPDPDRYRGLNRTQALTLLEQDLREAKNRAQDDIDTFFQAAAVLRALKHEELAVRLEAMAARNMSTLAVDLPQFEVALRMMIELMTEDGDIIT